MNPEGAKAAAEVLCNGWQGESATTAKVIAAVKDDNRAYKPDAKSRTAWELATHLATADVWFIDSIISGNFAFTTSENSMSRWRVMPPASNAPFSSRK